MKKKLVSLLLTATMVMGVLSGCGNGKMSVSQTGDTSTDEKVEMTAADDVDGTTITFWHSMGGVNGQAIDTLVNAGCRILYTTGNTVAAFRDPQFLFIDGDNLEFLMLCQETADASLIFRRRKGAGRIYQSASRD